MCQLPNCLDSDKTRSSEKNFSPAHHTQYQWCHGDAFKPGRMWSNHDKIKGSQVLAITCALVPFIQTGLSPIHRKWNKCLFHQRNQTTTSACARLRAHERCYRHQHKRLRFNSYAYLQDTAKQYLMQYQAIPHAMMQSVRSAAASESSNRKTMQTHTCTCDTHAHTVSPRSIKSSSAHLTRTINLSWHSSSD